MTIIAPHCHLIARATDDGSPMFQAVGDAMPTPLPGILDI